MRPISATWTGTSLTLSSWVSAGLMPCVERVKGIEPSYAAWEAAVLPLNYTRGRETVGTGRLYKGGRLTVQSARA